MRTAALDRLSAYEANPIAVKPKRGRIKNSSSYRDGTMYSSNASLCHGEDGVAPGLELGFVLVSGNVWEDS